MHAVKRFFEWYLGIPPSGPGEGTDWRIETRSVGPEGWPAWLVIALALVGAALVVLIYLREGGRLPQSRRLLLAGLRLSALGVVAAMLSQATLAVDRTGLPVLAVLVDDSASMSLVESSEASGANASTATRLDLVRKTLTDGDGRFLEELSERFRVRLYRFSDDATPLGTGETEEADHRALAAQIEAVSAEGRETRPASAVRRVLDDLRGVSPSAIVVLTDGVSTSGETESLSAVATLAARRRVPLYPVGVGSDGPARDLELYELAADEIAFLGDPVRITARFRTFGLRGRPVTLTLTDAQSDDVLAEATVEAGPDGRPTEAELGFTPEVEGEFDLRVAVKSDATEANRENNAASRRVSVRKQKVRVLLADHLPRYEFRYLKSLLEREPTIDLDTVLQQADLGFSAEDRTALERFPLRRDEILSYDVIMIGDLDPGLLGSEVLSTLAEFVRGKGGGLIGIAGPEFFPMRYAGTALEPLLPVELGDLSVPLDDAVLRDDFHPELTLPGRRSAMFRLEATEAESLAAWGSLPGLYWRADASTLRPGAVALAEVADRGGRSRPLIALQRYGAGKMLLHLTDETWRWRFRTGDTYFGRYWIQAIRFLSRASLLGGDRGAELTTDRRRYPQGDPVTLRMRFLDEGLIPVGTGGVTVVIDDRAGGRREVELSRPSELSDSFEGRIDRLPEGVYHAWVREPAFTGSPPAADFRIDPPERELARRAADLADLRRAAELSAGKYHDLADANDLPRQLPAGRPVRLKASSPRPLWNRAELLLALAGCLTAEWVLRKRGRLS